MPDIKIDEHGNLVTELPRVWVSRCGSGWLHVSRFRPTIDAHGFYIPNRIEPDKDRGLALDCEAGVMRNPLLVWLKANIRDRKGGPIVGLPGPGEVYEVTLI